MKKHLTPPLLLFTFLLFCQHIAAQKYESVLNKPRAYDPPAVSDKEAEDQKTLESAGAPYTRDPWIVVSDRDGNQTYNELGNGAQPLKTINFRDWFYVVAEQGRWIHIGKAEIIGGKNIVAGTFQDYGWVEKSKMLLWNSSLIDPNTKIHKKAFLLNKVEDIIDVVRSKDEKAVDIYHGPDMAKATEDPKTIYEFYFIYKDEGDRCLLGKDDQFSTRGVESLIGWVRKNKFVTWNTRIALEPNFEEAAFEERKNNKNYHLFGFKSPISADYQAKKGEVDDNDAYWDDDPVTLDAAKMSKSNKRRFNGNVVRFPLLSCQGDGRYYRTGVVGEITYQTLKGDLQKMDEVYYAKLLAEFRQKEEARYSYDVLFAIEATPALSSFRDAIIEGVKRMKAKLIDVENVRFGLVLYRDVPEEGRNKLCTVKPFTDKSDDFISWLKAAEFSRWEDSDAWTAMNYGLEQGLLDAGFDDNHTNIIVLLGNNADFMGDRLRKEKDKGHKAARFKNETGEMEPLVNKVVELLAERSAHIIAIQCRNEEGMGSPGKKFQEQARDLILQSATTQFQKYKNSEFVGEALGIGNPRMPELEEGNELLLEDGSCFGMLRKPALGKQLSSEDMSASLEKGVEKILTKVEGMWKKLHLIVEEGGSFDQVNPGDFKEGMLGLFSGLIEDNKLTKEDLKKINSKKYKLYAQVFMARQVENAKAPTCSMVLFMPEDDLRRYLDVLKQLKSAADKSADVQREYLYNTLIDLAGQYSGSNTGKDLKQYTVDELRNLMQGVQSETCGLPAKWDKLKIEQVKDRRKMNDNAVSTWVQEILNQTLELQKIANDKKYEFKYVTGNNTYYWIPIEYTF